MNVNEKLHPFHIAILIHTHQLGVVFFALPRVCAENFGTNSWIGILILSVVSVGNIGLIHLVWRFGKGSSIFDILCDLPVWLRVPLYVFLVCLWSMLGCMVAKQYVLTYQMVSFPTTNPMVFKIGIDVMMFYLVIQGIYAIIKTSTVFFFGTAWLSLSWIANLSDFNWERLTPFILKEGTNYLGGSLEVYMAFLGYELSLLLIPYAMTDVKWFRSVYYGHLLTTFFYVCAVIIASGYFSFEQLRMTMYPLLELASNIELPIIERMETMLYTIFLLIAVLTSVLYYWMAMETGKQLVPRLNVKVSASILMSITYMIAFIPETLYEIGVWLRKLSHYAIGTAFLLPLMVLFLLLLRRVRGRKAEWP